MKTTTPPNNMSKNNFPWSSSRKVQNEETLDLEEPNQKQTILDGKNDQNNEKKTSSSSSNSSSNRRRRLQAVAVSRIRSVLTALNINKPSLINYPTNLTSLGPKVIGTLFGHRKGHVHFVFQRENTSNPVFFVELATPITHLVKEMASGLVRIALECDKQDHSNNNNNNTLHGKRRKRRLLLDEPVWRTYCNGKKCGFANKREIGSKETKILKAVEPISMGAGVLPGFNGSGSNPDGELMYMRAKFERVVGSRDSEAFYMMNPDFNGAPELSLYLLRV